MRFALRAETALALALLACGRTVVVGSDLAPDAADTAGTNGPSASSTERAPEVASCGGEQKVCTVNGRTECVSTTDPRYGCEATNCTPCYFDNAQSACAAGACALGACRSGWADCDKRAENGCEEIVEVNWVHCGPKCETCQYDGATALCEAGICRMGSCNYGRFDCDGDPRTGCESTAPCAAN